MMNKTTALNSALSPIPAVTRANNKAKYRPVLTAIQIEHILYLAKSEQPLSSMSMSLISTLAPFQAKIQNAAMTPAYILVAPKPNEADVMASLGAGAPDRVVGNIHTSIDWSGLSKQEYWEACYDKFTANPVTCNLSEIEASKEHAYLNELMSVSELAEFEAGFVSGDKV
jgi:hypothetical protein